MATENLEFFPFFYIVVLSDNDDGFGSLGYGSAQRKQIIPAGDMGKVDAGEGR
jgi:hypothetical protein